MATCFCTGVCQRNNGICPNFGSAPGVTTGTWRFTPEPAKPLTEADLRRIIREELGK